jgi:NAD(P)-dependent dehydrogenase (short-subunit alcohol dehydrogenase family)
MDLGIAGKVAFVGGGSKGMGRAVAEQLGREGCLVAVVALGDDKAAIDDTVRAIADAGGTAVGIAGDLTTRDDVERAVASVTDALGSLDIAVVNVDGPGKGNFSDVSDEAFALAMDRMTMSAVYVARAVLPRMKARGWGRMVVLNSVGASEPQPGRILVNPSRAAVVALNKSLSDEFAGDGITVNTIATGWIGTDRMYRGLSAEADQRGVALDDVVAELVQQFPARRIGLPEEMASVIAFLCSQGAGYITGELIHVDGGYHRGAF